MRTFLRMHTEARGKLKILVCRYPHRKKHERQGGCCPLLRASLKPPGEWQSVLGFPFKGKDMCPEWAVGGSCVSRTVLEDVGTLNLSSSAVYKYPWQLCIDPRTEPGPLPIKGQFPTPDEFP